MLIDIDFAKGKKIYLSNFRISTDPWLRTNSEKCQLTNTVFIFVLSICQLTNPVFIFGFSI